MPTAWLRTALGVDPDAWNRARAELRSGTCDHVTTAAAADYFPRPGVSYLPVTGLPASRVALAWRSGERDPACLSFVDAARRVVAAKRAPSRPARP